MNWIKKLNEASVVFALLRVATAIVALLGTAFALWLSWFGVSAVSLKPFGAINLAGCAGLASVAVTSGCCYVALYTFFRLCGRLARGSAFTEENAQAMHRIARLLLISAVAVFAGSAVVVIAINDLFLTLYHPLVAVFLGASLLSHALAVLVTRAAALQSENDLTI